MPENWESRFWKWKHSKKEAKVNKEIVKEEKTKLSHHEKKLKEQEIFIPKEIHDIEEVSAERKIVLIVILMILAIAITYLIFYPI